MARSQLDLQATRAMFLAVADGMVGSTSYLTDLDRAIGDGDHGIGMQHGFEAVRRELEGQSFATLGKLVQAVGTTLMMSIGGASGAIFGTLFRGGGAKLATEEALTTRNLSVLLSEGLAAVKARGGAKAGDKTMVDALEPAAAAVAGDPSAPLGEALARAAEAARLGMEKTREMLASTGKAKTLGERSRGHADPGAASTHLILKFMAEFCGREGGEA